MYFFGEAMEAHYSLHHEIEDARYQKKTYKKIQRTLKLQRNYINIEWNTTNEGAHICKLNI